MGNMTLQASSVPDWAIRMAADRMRDLGIPVRQTTLVRAAIAGFIGLDDNRIRELAVSAARRERGAPVNKLDEILADKDEVA